MSNGDKKGGLFDSIVEAAKHELFEEDPSTSDTSRSASPSLGQPLDRPAPIANAVSAAMSLAPAAPSVDPEALKLVKANVYVNIGDHPSRFVKFLKMLDALGKPQDALRALQVADESITARGIVEDITAHLGLLEQCNKEAAAQFDAASTERLGGRDKEIQVLQGANQNAASEIERHQKETSERNGKIAALQQARADDEAKITAARQRETAAEAVVRGELESAKQLLSSKG